MSAAANAIAPARASLLILAGALLFGFLLAQTGAATAPVSDDEALTLWIVGAAPTLGPMAPTDLARALIDEGRALLDRAVQGLHPPGWALLLKGWSLLVGDSLWTLRLLSALLVTLGAALSVALALHLLPESSLRTVVAGSVLLLSLLPITVYAASHAAPLAALFAAAALSHYAYARWSRAVLSDRPRWHHRALYVVALALALYLHITAYAILSAHALLTLARVFINAERPVGILSLYAVSRLLRLSEWLLLVAAALLLFVPWSFLDAPSVVSLSLSGVLLPGLAAVLLLPLLPLLIVPLYALSLESPLGSFGVPLALIAALLLGSVLTPPTDADADALYAQLAESRAPTEPLIHTLPPYSPAGWAMQAQGLSAGLAVDLSWWGAVTPEDAAGIVARLTQSDTALWLLLQEGDARTPPLLDALAAAERPPALCAESGALRLYRAGDGGCG